MGISDWLIDRASKREADEIVLTDGVHYLHRWYIIPKNILFNIYLHNILRSDYDRALHDHPWSNCSVLLRGSYTEHTIARGGINRYEILKEGSIKIRWTGSYAHRVVLHNGPIWSLFITGPKYRKWGFHCPHTGWVHHKYMKSGCN